MLEQLLKQLGFTEKEIVVYLCVLEHGKLSAAAVSRITKINRTTVYSVSKELIAKGVLVEDVVSTQRYFSAVSPEELRTLYTKEEEALKTKKQSVEQLITELASVPKNKNYSVPKIRFIDERHVNDFLYKALPTWIESSKKLPSDDQNWWGFQDTSFIDAYPEWFKYHWQIFPKDFGTRLFTNKKPSEEEFAKHVAKNIESSERRQIKYWARSKDFTATHAVLGDYVLFAITNQHPHYCVEIHDAVMAENIREMFKAMWAEVK
jgi:predicted transcriptional regulator